MFRLQLPYLGVVSVWLRADDTEGYREKDQAIKQANNNHQEKYLK